MGRADKSKTGREEHSKSEGESGGDGVIDRRVGVDRRRVRMIKDGKEVAPTGLERRRGPGRRLSDFTKAAEEGEMTTEQFLFLVAIDTFKQANDKTFPTWTDVLEVVRLLGYRKTMPSELNLTRAEDWTEAANAPSNVRPDGWERRFEKPARGFGARGGKSERELTDEALDEFERSYGKGKKAA
ncbi:MAG: hypothetical protein R3B57_06660 [Phycisphaerales bacterium]